MIKRIIIVFSAVVLMSAIYAFVWNSSNSFANQFETRNNHGSSVLSQSDSVSIIGVGDIMMGTNYPSASYLPPNDGKDLFKPVLSILKDADITFGNLEGCILNSGGTPKRCSDPSKCYAFRQPEHYVSYLKEAGFDVMSIANNHLGDFGDAGREKTVEVLKNAGIQFAGQIKYPKVTFELNGVKYGFCAFAPNTGTVQIADIAGAQKIVKELAAEVDIVIVSFHGGAEGSQYRNVTKKTEIFYGENRGNVYDFAHKVIDAGADVVFGHGPHVTRAIELYNGRFIAYSLGNFCTYGRFSLDGAKGMAPIIKLYTTKKGEFLSGKIYATMQKGEGGPLLDPSNKVIQEIIDLTKTDFPDTKLTIKADGQIMKKL